jgi:hypothetical protein
MNSKPLNRFARRQGDYPSGVSPSPSPEPAGTSGDPTFDGGRWMRAPGRMTIRVLFPVLAVVGAVLIYDAHHGREPNPCSLDEEIVDRRRA